MTTFSDFVDGTYKNTVEITQQPIRLYKAKIDFSYRNMTAANNDVIQAMIIPAKSWVLNVWLNVVSAAASGTKIDLGYGSDTDHWGLNLPLSSSGVVDQKTVVEEQNLIMIYENRVPLAYSPVYFASQDTIDIKIKGSTNITSGVVEVCALILRQR